MVNKVYLRFFVVIYFAALNSLAVYGDAYTIKNIQVQSKGTSASSAKDGALKNGRKEAFQIMIQKLVDKKQQDLFESTDDQTIEFLIDGVQVINEQMGPKSYKAIVSFDFNKERMSDFLRNKAVPFVVPVHKTVLVLPVFSDGAKTYLFEKENIWFDLWKKHSFNQALLTFVIPNGDLTDIGALDPEDALIGASHKIIALAQRYQVSAVIVPYVTVTQDGKNLNVRLDFQEYDSKGIQKANNIRSHNLSELSTTTSKQKLLTRLLPVAIENIQDFCKAQFGSTQEHNLVYLKVPTKSSDDYYKYIKLLNESTMVQEVQPVELSKEYSVLRVKTLYTLEDLLGYFKDRGYNFEASQDIVKPYAHEALPQR